MKKKGQLHAWVAFLITIFRPGPWKKRCKELHWYLHRFIHNVRALEGHKEDKGSCSTRGNPLHFKWSGMLDELFFFFFCWPASRILVICAFLSLCAYQCVCFCQLWEFLSVHSVTSLTPVPSAPLLAMAELGNMQPRFETTSIPYYQESAHCRSQGFNLFVPVSAQD